VQIGICVACFEAGQYTESLRLIEQLEVLKFPHFSTSQALLKLKGMSLLKLNDYQNAKDNFFKCLRISAEDSVDIRLELAAILLDTGEYRVAIEVWLFWRI
jgi:tetratricopeptide (TPR) repeat protein